MSSRVWSLPSLPLTKEQVQNLFGHGSFFKSARCLVLFSNFIVWMPITSSYFYYEMFPSRRDCRLFSHFGKVDGIPIQRKLETINQTPKKKVLKKKTIQCRQKLEFAAKISTCQISNFFCSYHIFFFEKKPNKKSLNDCFKENVVFDDY